MTSNQTSERTDFAVVCALEVEREAVCRAFQLKDRDREVRGKRRYWRGRLRVGGKTFGVVVTQLPEMANVHAAVRTSVVLQHWNPQTLLLVGIAAAALETQQLGDVVVGRSVYYYELGKAGPDGPLPQPDMIPADPVLLDAAVNTRKWSGRVGLSRPDGTTKRPRRSFGDIASGEKVIGDPRFRNEVTKFDRKIRALEMEGYGFSVAALQAGENIHHLVIRGLCDYADQTKGDEWHAYASASAAAYARHLLMDWPFNPIYQGDERKASDRSAADTGQGIDAVAEKPLRATSPAAEDNGSSEHKAEAIAPKAHNQATQELINLAASQPWPAVHGAWQSVRRAAKRATLALKGERLTTEDRVQHLHDEGAVDDDVLQRTWTLRRRYFDMRKQPDAVTSRDATDFVEDTSTLVQALLIAAPGEPSASAKPNRPQDP